jgi:hypothetical protein
MSVTPAGPLKQPILATTTGDFFSPADGVGTAGAWFGEPGAGLPGAADWLPDELDEPPALAAGLDAAAEGRVVGDIRAPAGEDGTPDGAVAAAAAVPPPAAVPESGARDAGSETGVFSVTGASTSADVALDACSASPDRFACSTRVPQAPPRKSAPMRASEILLFTTTFSRSPSPEVRVHVPSRDETIA